MSDQNAVGQLLEVAGRIRDLKQQRPDLTWENVFENPAYVGLRDSFVDLLGAADTASAMLIAVAQLETKWAELLAAGASLDQLDAVARAARGLSYVAQARAAEPKQIFVFTLKQLVPWLESLAKLGITVAMVAIG